MGGVKEDSQIREDDNSVDAESCADEGHRNITVGKEKKLSQSVLSPFQGEIDGAALCGDLAKNETLPLPFISSLRFLDK